MKSLAIEGWRFIPHSFAIVSQQLCLATLERPDVSLYFRDAPFISKKWRESQSILPASQEEALRRLPRPPQQGADALLRIYAPFELGATTEARRSFVWATSEFLQVTQFAVAGDVPVRAALKSTQSTIITCSQWAARGFLNTGAPAGRIVVVPCGVDTTVFHPVTPSERAELRRQFGWQQQFVALNVGAATENKGIDLCMRAVAHLAKSHPELRLALKGTDSLYASHDLVKQCVAGLSRSEAALLEGRMSYIGHSLSAEQIAQLYQSADVYLSPYRAEGFNLPVLEAAACGLPVIATRGGATDDFVDDDWCRRVDAALSDGGTRLEPDFDQLIATLDALIADAAWRARAAEAGPRLVRERYTWKHSADKILDLVLSD